MPLKRCDLNRQLSREGVTGRPKSRHEHLGSSSCLPHGKTARQPTSYSPAHHPFPLACPSTLFLACLFSLRPARHARLPISTPDSPSRRLIDYSLARLTARPSAQLFTRSFIHRTASTPALLPFCLHVVPSSRLPACLARSPTIQPAHLTCPPFSPLYSLPSVPLGLPSAHCPLALLSDSMPSHPLPRPPMRVPAYPLAQQLVFLPTYPPARVLAHLLSRPNSLASPIARSPACPTV